MCIAFSPCLPGAVPMSGEEAAAHCCMRPSAAPSINDFLLPVQEAGFEGAFHCQPTRILTSKSPHV